MILRQLVQLPISKRYTSTAANHDKLSGCTNCASGKYSAKVRQTNDTCISCTSGKYGKAAGTGGDGSNSDAEDDCQVCGMGKYSSAANTECIACPPDTCNNWYASYDDRKYFDGIWVPDLSKPGKWKPGLPDGKNIGKMTTPDDDKAEWHNSTDVCHKPKQCPKGAFVSTHCAKNGGCKTCGPGLYNDDTTNGFFQSKCKRCRSGRYIPPALPSGQYREKDESGTWKIYKSDEKYAKAEFHASPVSCIDCLIGSAERDRSRCEVCNPSYSTSGLGSTKCQRCTNPKRCLGAGECLQGTRGQYCANCARGYHKKGKECKTCPDPGLTYVIMAVLVILFLGFLVVILQVDGTKSQTNTISMAGTMSIALARYQFSLDWFNIDMQWPQFLLDFMEFVKHYLTFDLGSLSPPECTINMEKEFLIFGNCTQCEGEKTGGAYDKDSGTGCALCSGTRVTVSRTFLTVMIVPILMMIMIIAYPFLKRYTVRKKIKMMSLKNGFLASYTTVFIVTIGAIVLPFDCTWNGDEAVQAYRLDAQQDLPCFGQYAGKNLFSVKKNHAGAGATSEADGDYSWKFDYASRHHDMPRIEPETAAGWWIIVWVSLGAFLVYVVLVPLYIIRNLRDPQRRLDQRVREQFGYLFLR